MKKIYMPIVFMTVIQCFYLEAMKMEKPTLFSSLLTQTAILSTEIERYRTSASSAENKEILSQLSSAELAKVIILSRDSDFLKAESLSKITWISKLLLGKYFDIIAKDIVYNSEIFEALLFAQKEERSGVSSGDVWFVTTDFIDIINGTIVKKSKDIEAREKTRIEQLKTELRAEIRGEIEKFAEYICTAFKKVDQNFGKFQFRACSYGGHPLGVSLVTACSFEPIPIIKIAGQKALALVTPE